MQMLGGSSVGMVYGNMYEQLARTQSSSNKGGKKRSRHKKSKRGDGLPPMQMQHPQYNQGYYKQDRVMRVFTAPAQVEVGPEAVVKQVMSMVTQDDFKNVFFASFDGCMQRDQAERWESKYKYLYAIAFSYTYFM